MKTAFRVGVLEFSNILEIAGARSESDFAGLLDAMEYGDQSDLSADDRREMCVASLQGIDPEEAAYLVLKHDFRDVLRDGQARNLAAEMLEEKLWEEYSDSSLHERFFNSGSLLYQAFPGRFPKPDAVRLNIRMTAENGAARDFLTPTLDESFLVRLLADGMDEHAVLHRLYGDELSGTKFPNAAEIVWIVRAVAVDPQTMDAEVISSGYWLDALEDVQEYESAAYADDVSVSQRS